MIFCYTHVFVHRPIVFREASLSNRWKQIQRCLTNAEGQTYREFEEYAVDTKIKLSISQYQMKTPVSAAGYI